MIFRYITINDSPNHNTDVRQCYPSSAPNGFHTDTDVRQCQPFPFPGCYLWWHWCATVSAPSISWNFFLIDTEVRQCQPSIFLKCSFYADNSVCLCCFLNGFSSWLRCTMVPVLMKTFSDSAYMLLPFLVRYSTTFSNFSRIRNSQWATANCAMFASGTISSFSI